VFIPPLAFRLYINRQLSGCHPVVAAVIGNDYQSDIAVDDISFAPGTCAGQTASVFICAINNATSVSSTSVCNFVPDCPDKSDELNCGAYA